MIFAEKHYFYFFKDSEHESSEKTCQVSGIEVKPRFSVNLKFKTLKILVYV
jgi:hypothetical protein